MKRLLVVLSVLFLAGCQTTKLPTVNIIPAVHAQAPAPLVIHREPICPTGCVAQESPGKFLSLRLGPNNFTDEQKWSYDLPYELKISMIDVWIGSADTIGLEMESRLQIQYPDGSFEEFWATYDKHGDERGEKQRVFNIKRTLPIGTRLILWHSPGQIVKHPGSDHCYTDTCQDTSWKLYN